MKSTGRQYGSRACWLLWGCHQQARQGLFLRLGFRHFCGPHFGGVQDARPRLLWPERFMGFDFWNESFDMYGDALVLLDIEST